MAHSGEKGALSRKIKYLTRNITNTKANALIRELQIK